MKTIIEEFNSEFPEFNDIRAVRSPLQVCPIGAHSDYQGGFVTGMTIDASVDMVYSSRKDGYVNN